MPGHEDMKFLCPGVFDRVLTAVDVVPFWQAMRNEPIFREYRLICVKPHNEVQLRR